MNVRPLQMRVSEVFQIGFTHWHSLMLAERTGKPNSEYEHCLV